MLIACSASNNEQLPTPNGVQGSSGAAGVAGSTSLNGQGGTTAGMGGASGSAGSKVTCEQLLVPNTCGTCLNQVCCQEVESCITKSECSVCVFEKPDDPACTEVPEATALKACLSQLCGDACTSGTGGSGPTAVVDCSPPVPSPSKGSCITLGEQAQCNPLTNQGCSADESCDYSKQGKYVCFPPPTTASICQPCNNQHGPFCQSGLTCFQGVCAHYCCNKSDCGTDKACDLSLVNNENLGICVDKAGQSGAAGAGGSSGGSGQAGAAGTTMGTGGTGTAGTGTAGTGTSGTGTAGTGTAGTVGQAGTTGSAGSTAGSSMGTAGSAGQAGSTAGNGGLAGQAGTSGSPTAGSAG
jgi:hypothetical protein